MGGTPHAACRGEHTSPASSCCPAHLCCPAGMSCATSRQSPRLITSWVCLARTPPAAAARSCWWCCSCHAPSQRQVRIRGGVAQHNSAFQSAFLLGSCHSRRESYTVCIRFFTMNLVAQSPDALTRSHVLSTPNRLLVRRRYWSVYQASQQQPARRSVTNPHSMNAM
jgi:hypothetical protein